MPPLHAPAAHISRSKTIMDNVKRAESDKFTAIASRAYRTLLLELVSITLAANLSPLSCFKIVDLICGTTFQYIPICIQIGVYADLGGTAKRIIFHPENVPCLCPHFKDD